MGGIKDRFEWLLTPLNLLSFSKFTFFVPSHNNHSKVIQTHHTHPPETVHHAQNTELYGVQGIFQLSPNVLCNVQIPFTWCEWSIMCMCLLHLTVMPCALVVYLHSLLIGPDLFYLLDYLTRRSEKLRFEKKIGSETNWW